MAQSPAATGCSAAWTSPRHAPCLLLLSVKSVNKKAYSISLHAEAAPADASGGKGKGRTVKTPLQKEVLEAIYQGVPSLSSCQSSNLVFRMTHLTALMCWLLQRKLTPPSSTGKQ